MQQKQYQNTAQAEMLVQHGREPVADTFSVCAGREAVRAAISGDCRQRKQANRVALDPQPWLFPLQTEGSITGP